MAGPSVRIAQHLPSLGLRLVHEIPSFLSLIRELDGKRIGLKTLNKKYFYTRRVTLLLLYFCFFFLFIPSLF